MNSFVIKVQNSLFTHRMVEAGDSVLVAVSGGPDSVALLHSLDALKEDLNIELTLAHLNHSARGEESEADSRFVQHLGERLRIKTFIEKKDVISEKACLKRSFQETARKVRMEFFEQVMTQSGSNKIALGHTLNDQAETVLMNLLRGSGLKGLGGMKPVRFPYIRPLFHCSRNEVMDFLSLEKIEFRRDSSNAKLDYLRNRVRLELIPFLQKNYNPAILECLFETSEILRGDNDCLQVLVDREFDRVVSRVPENDTLELEVDPFLQLHPALQKRLIRKCVQTLKGDLKSMTYLHTQSVLRLFQASQTGKRVDLPGPVQARRQAERLVFKRIPEGVSGIVSNVVDSSGEEGYLTIPGKTLVVKTGVTLQAKIIDPVPTGFPRTDTHQAYFDFDKTGEQIKIRFFRPGDRMSPLGMTGTKKLKSLFIDEKVPQEIRSKIPILTNSHDDIIWVYGTRISHPYRVTSDTKRVLFIKGLY